MDCCNNKKEKNKVKESCCDENTKSEKDVEMVSDTKTNNEENTTDQGDEKMSVLEESSQIKEAVTSALLKQKMLFWRNSSVALSLLLVVSLVFQFSGVPIAQKVGSVEIIPRALASEVVPEEGVELPITWGDLGKRMIEAGVIDEEKFETLYERRGGLSEKSNSLLYGEGAESVTITSENSGELLNLLWAFGLSNKSEILENGPITSYDGKESPSREEMLEKAGRMAATGGWPLSVGNPMDHYSAHEFVTLTGEEWELVERVASGIYRPCCNNPSHFPDCNHGMAMLGLLELLAVEGLTESEMFDVALSVNSYWYPDTYLTIAEYMNINGVSWSDVSSKEMLSAAYSSGSGFATVRQSIEEPVQSGSGGGGCGA